ncbi:hypothetical protein EPO66_05195 [bacterium]|nr:MAG: hypothetical protein EPO66_05195 [bacterium]
MGNKKGIAVLSNGDLKFIFNNGKIIIYYAGLPITKGKGWSVFTSYPRNNMWSISSDLYWAVKVSSAEEIFAEGSNAEGKVEQVWKISLGGGYINWQVNILGDEANTSNMVLYFNSEFNNWDVQENSGEFPEFGHKVNWQDLNHLINIHKILGLRFAGNNSANIVLDFANEKPQIFNSGYEENSRVLQLGINNRSAVISFKTFLEVDGFNSYILKERQEFLLKKQKEQEELFLKKKKEEEELRQKQQKKQEELLREQERQAELLRQSRTIVSGHTKLFVDLEEKAIRIYYKDKEITKKNGLHGSFLLNGTWYDFTACEWEVKRNKDKELGLIFKFNPGFLLFQKWVLFFDAVGSLGFKIDFDGGKGLNLTNYQLKIGLENDFSGWRTPFESGDFSNKEYVEEISPVRLKDSKVNKVTLARDVAGKSEGLLINVCYDFGKVNLGIYKQKNIESEILYANFSIFNSENKSFRSGLSLEGNIVFGENLKFADEGVLNNIPMVHSAGINFSFDQGRGRLLFNQKELTTGLGLYTAIRSLGIWHDSYQAVWQVRNKTDKVIVACGNWFYLPVKQEWKIELSKNGSLNFTVNTEILEEVAIDIEQVGLMLDCEYRDWFIPGMDKYKFLDEFTLGYDILPFRFWYGIPPKNQIGVSGESLPAIVFENNGQPGFKGIVENTDYFYKARLLQYQKEIKNRRCLKGASSFSAEVHLEL